MDCLTSAGTGKGLRGAGLCFACLFTLCLESGCTLALLNATASGDRDTALGLLRDGEDINRGFPVVGTSPLMLAAAHGHIDVLRALLDAGADVNAADFTGWTALHAAALKGDKAIVSLLLEHGALPSENHWYLPSPASIARMIGHDNLVPLLGTPSRTSSSIHDADKAR